MPGFLKKTQDSTAIWSCCLSETRRKRYHTAKYVETFSPFEVDKNTALRIQQAILKLFWPIFVFFAQTNSTDLKFIDLKLLAGSGEQDIYKKNCIAEDTDYGHTMAKSLFLCSPNSNSNTNSK